MSAPKIPLGPAAVITILAMASSANADGFRKTITHGPIELVIEQAYTDDGFSNPLVTVNGAQLRQFNEKQKLDIVHSNNLGGTEEIIIMHHWDGGVGCAGSLTIFSLSDEGFYQSADLGDCTETFQIDEADDEGLKVLEILSYSDETKMVETGRWTYFDGNLIEN